MNTQAQELLKALPVLRPRFGDTRGGPSVTFFESISAGLSANGGLFMPEKFPHTFKNIPDFFTKILPALTIPEIATLVHRVFIPREDINDDELSRMMHEAYNFEIPLEKLDAHTFVARLDNGPTASFKDLAARSIARLLDTWSEVHKKSLNIVVATSGDTGVAIADAFGKAHHITVTVMYPEGGVSEVQEKQMLRVQERNNNIQVIPVLGNFDNCQDIAKILQLTRELNSQNKKGIEEQISYKLKQDISDTELEKLSEDVRTLNLSSANSINIWRLIPQMVQYFVSYAHLLKTEKIKAGEAICFAIPTGNVGHMMAGIFAQELGLPISKFIIGTNANNVMANIIGSGVIKHKEFTNTSAPSMDILDPSNLERLLYFAAQKTGHTEPIPYEQMKKDIKNISPLEDIPLSKYGVTPEMLQYLQQLIWSEDTETDDELYAMMSYQYQKNNIVLEPHGVSALIATIRTREKKALAREANVVVFETAHPDKFPSALTASFLEDATYNHHPELEALRKLKKEDMHKPKVSAVDIIAVAQKIKEFATKGR